MNTFFIKKKKKYILTKKSTKFLEKCASKFFLLKKISIEKKFIQKKLFPVSDMNKLCRNSTISYQKSTFLHRSFLLPTNFDSFLIESGCTMKPHVVNYRFACKL